MTDLIAGGGGGGGGGKGGGGGAGSANVAADNLDSTQIARIIDLIGEGEIEGFPSGRTYNRGTTEYNRALLKDIYFNNTPLVREDANPAQPYDANDFNFRDVEVYTRYGTQDQTYLPFTSTQEEVSVNTKVTKAVPVTRNISDANLDAIRVTISVPALQIFRSNGNVDGASIELQIQFSYAGGPFTTVLTDTITGRTADLYQRTYRINLSTPPPVDVRVVRVTDDAPASGTNNETVVDEIYWASYTELIYAKTAYPNSALVGIKINAEQFSSIPERMYRVRGIKVRLPSNAVVDGVTGRLSYEGIWNGSFQAAQWTTDPVWILWDLLTSKRYGFGDYISASSLDKWAFLAASQYASALVPDGLTLNGTEPRFSCNVSIQTQEDAYKLINDLCSVFRAMPFWSAGSLTIAQDSPADAIYLFNQSNVTEEGFSYSGSSLKTRSTVVAVRYFDMNARQYAYEVVEDADSIARYGILKKEVEAFACTSRGQARRVAEWILYEEHNTSEVVTFKTGIAAGQYVRPGSVIKVMDPVRAGRIRAGRIAESISATQVRLDRNAELMFTDSVPSTFIFQVVLPTDSATPQVQVINGATINSDLVTLPTALYSLPEPGTPWMITLPELSGQPFRVLTVQEEEQGDSYVITGVKYDFQKYDYIERGVPLSPVDISDLNVPPPTPTDLTASEVLYESNGQVLSKLLVSWRPQSSIARYVFRYRYNNGNWTTVFTRSPDHEINNSDVGRYEFELQAENAGFKRSGIATADFDALGKTAPPATIPDLFIAPIDDKNAELYWPQSIDLDVRIGGEVRIRYTPEIGVNATWGRANDIVPAVNGSSTRKIVPLLEGTYLIRAVDSLGNESAGVAAVVVDLPAPQDTFLVQEYREDDDSPPFQGSASSMFYSADEGGLALTATGLIDDIPSWDAITTIDFYGNISSSGSYQFLNTLDLSQVYDIDLLATLKTRAFQPGNAWDERTDLIDAWSDIDGDDLSAVNAQLYVRTTNDNPSGTPTWGSWQPFVNNTTRGRGFQFKVEARSTNTSQNILIEQLGVVTKLQRRTEIQRNQTSGTVTFPTAFYGTPSVGITAQDMQQGDYFTVSSVSRTGFTVTFRDSGGSIVTRTFDYQAVGHGRQIT
jgi:predicted phage tail protein